MFNILSLGEYCLASSEIDISGCQIVQALMVAPWIVIGDELLELAFELTGQIINFEIEYFSSSDTNYRCSGRINGIAPTISPNIAQAETVTAIGKGVPSAANP